MGCDDSPSDHAYCECHTRPPRTWALPPAPGPEVKAVRGRRGRWIRGHEMWYLDSAPGNREWGVDEIFHRWDRVVYEDGPLTDCTHELEEEQ